MEPKWASHGTSHVSDLVVVTDEDVNGRQEQLKHRLLVALFHLKTQPLQEAGRTLGTLAAAVLEAQRKGRIACRLMHQAVFININTHQLQKHSWQVWIGKRYSLQVRKQIRVKLSGGISTLLLECSLCAFCVHAVNVLFFIIISSVC